MVWSRFRTIEVTIEVIMKDLVEKIYEGFYRSVVKFDNTPESVHYYTIKQNSFGKEAETDIKNYNIAKGDRPYLMISKDAAVYGIDSISDLIVDIDSKPGSRMSFSASFYIDNYCKASKKPPKEFKTYTASAVKKIIIKLCEDTSNARIIGDMYSDAKQAENNIKMAFVMACLKANNIVSKDFKYVDLNKENMKEAEIGLYVEAAIQQMSFNAYTLPPTAAQLSAKSSEERVRYDDTLSKIDSLKADIILLRDNAYPFNQMVEKTINDIESRCNVIARLANKFRK